MKKQIEEKVLLYNFKNEEELNKLKEIIKGLNMGVVDVKHEEHLESIGALLGLRGFSKHNKPIEESFDFEHEFMLFKDFTQNRYRKVIDAMKEAGLAIPPCKAVLTPTNRFWSLRKICENMAKEHLAAQERKEQAQQEK